MKLVGLSRDGCWTMLALSSVVLVLEDVFMYHRFELSFETAPFIALIMLCVVRLLPRERAKIT